MRNLFLLMAISFCLVQNAFARYDSIGVKEINGVKYIMHKVEKSQGLFALSKRYGVPVEDIKAANNGIETLALDQIVLIPMPKVVVEEKKFYHKVEKGETLYKISKLYNVSVDNLKKWNNLQDEAIKEGSEILIIQTVKYVEVEKGSDKTPPKVTQDVSKGDISEEGIATWIEDPTIDSRKALALHKKAPVGTIILVTNLLNDKQVYVKVVGNLPANEHSNEIIKLSKFAAKQLKIRDQFTRVRLSYHIE
ncbi:MAG TPA: LysM peptidoglycan-binding domain-containing protein [Bacteroidia bacterium]|nr:LysM peptidoglycan-binding domain-containing protein [Sphingobacteriales bacterium]HPD64574.1 LysM peptidoglycan-binding domain-containing protein [Bacteroidia bacterium]HRS58330.1 LysM peptidoglycan-binding domain-containing protein [Bacteroidia bacterium]HRU69023.1 LysM peptidoglycan-binding domain-containing protein [Bacteroidia bacterium]